MADINDLKDICISSGTLRAEDLLPKFMGILKDYAPEKFNEFIKGYPELDGWEDFLEADWRIISDDTKMNASDELFGLLNDIAPEGTMFSSTEGDGADFGFWLVEEKLLDDDEGEKSLKQMAKDGKSPGEVAADIRYDVATALDMAADKAEDLMTKFGLDKIYVLRAKGLSPKAIANKILKACESKDEGWLGGFYSRQDVLDAMDGGILNKDWKLEKRFGNWGCYVNQDTGRPLVLQVMVSQDRNGDWGYKPVTSDMGPVDTNIQAAKWLKPRLEEWVEKNPDLAKDVPDYEWGWIEKCLGKETANKDRKNLVSSLVKGDKIKLIDTVADGAVVTFIDMITPTKMRILHNGREMSCKTSFIDRKVEEFKSEAKDEAKSPKEEVKNVLMGLLKYPAFCDKISTAGIEKDINRNIEALRDAFLGSLDFQDGSFKYNVMVEDGEDGEVDHGPMFDACASVTDKILEILGLPGSVWNAVQKYLFYEGVDENIVSETKKSEATRYYGYGKNDAIDKEDNDFMWQVAYDWFVDKLPEKLAQYADKAVIDVIDKDSRAYEEIVTMDDYYDYLETYGPAVIEEITGGFSESKKKENLTDKEEHEWYRFWFDDVKKHIVPGKSGYVEHNCKMLPYSDVRQMWGVAAMAKELCDNFRRYLSYRGYTNSKGSPFAEISWRAEDAGDLLTAMNKADGSSSESKKTESSGATLASIYGDGDVSTHENSADGFYVDERDPMGFAVLNNDTATMEELFSGKAVAPEKPWTYAGWHEDTDAPENKDGSYPYIYDWEREYDLNFVNDWKRIVGDKNNEKALELLLQYAPDFIPSAMDFWNAFHAGYSKGLLRKLFDNIFAVVDKDDPGNNYLGYGDYTYDEVAKFLEGNGASKNEALNTAKDFVYSIAPIGILIRQDGQPGFKDVKNSDDHIIVGFLRHDNTRFIIDWDADKKQGTATRQVMVDDKDSQYGYKWVTPKSNANVTFTTREELKDFVEGSWDNTSSESNKSESYQDWIAFYFCKDSQGAEYAVYPQDVHKRNGNTVVGLQSRYGYHTGYRKEYILNSLTPIPLDEVDDSAIYKKLSDGEDREIIAIDKKDAERIMNASNPLSELKKVVQEYDIYKGEGIANVKKSESLTLKQKELKDMARYGEAEDITTISDAEAKELKKKGIETVGVSRGTYGMNGALLRDREGNKYVITARSSNLFYFV